jgi:glycosyltransferase involved in cell wall biosynthesis
MDPTPLRHNDINETTRPLVSVVIPAFNVGRFVGDALKSVLAQGYPALEIFVVDDGSSDDTCEVVERYANDVTLIRQKNAGAAVARNEGIARARGKYIALLDADDFWLPGKLHHQVAHLESHPDVGMCCTGWHVLFPDPSGNYEFPKQEAPRQVHLDPNQSGWIYCELLMDCIVWTSTVVMRRELCECLSGFNPALRRGQDYDYWLRASRQTRIDRFSEQLAVYRMEEGARARKFPDTNWELEVVRGAIDKWGLCGPDGRTLPADKIRKRLWELNFRFAYSQFHSGRYGVARQAFRAALRERPAHLKTQAYFLASALRR